MLSGHAFGRGGTLIKTPSRRQQAQHRRWAVVAAVVALALTSVLVGVLTHRDPAPPNRATAGPFSYFPSE